MPECKQEMEARGDRFIPRSCPSCGLGPCTEKIRNENAAIKQIAGLIRKLSWRDMNTLAKAFNKSLDVSYREEVLAEAFIKMSDEFLAGVKRDPNAQEPLDFPR